jgi:hypothetical protein
MFVFMDSKMFELLTFCKIFNIVIFAKNSDVYKLKNILTYIFNFSKILKSDNFQLG